MELSNEDREALGDWWVSAEDDAWGLATLYPFVEAVIARHVEAALNAAADTEGWISVEAEKHLPDTIRGGCVCGFCAWSPEHVAVMAFREGFQRHRARIVRSQTT